jgi:hypothetical protein
MPLAVFTAYGEEIPVATGYWGMPSWPRRSCAQRSNSRFGGGKISPKLINEQVRRARDEERCRHAAFFDNP